MRMPVYIQTGSFDAVQDFLYLKRDKHKMNKKKFKKLKKTH